MDKHRKTSTTAVKMSTIQQGTQGFEIVFQGEVSVPLPLCGQNATHELKRRNLLKDF